jgi:hypothetical protein
MSGERERIRRRRARKERRETGFRLQIAEKQLNAHTGKWEWPATAPWERKRRSERRP